MKRVGHLYRQINERENLCLAFSKAAKGKHGRREVMTFRENFEENIQDLIEQIFDQKVRVGNYHFFHVHDPKKRLICAASFSERVLHHAIMNICEPALESYAIYDTYACRKGKGGHKAIERTQQFSRRFDWYLKLDISRYFDSIDHDILLALLKRRFKDKELLMLFERILDTYLTRPGKGVPIGNLFSQHMANFYLGYLDHWVKEVLRIRGYVRYMDDFILWAHEKESLKKTLDTLSLWLQKTLKLKLNQNIQLNRCSRGIPFLGYRVYPQTVRLGSSSKKRFIRKFRQYEKQFHNGIWSEATLSRHMEPLVAFTRGADSNVFRSNVFHRFGVLS